MAGELIIDPDRQAVLVGGREIRLWPREMALLSYLLRNQGLVLSRDQLLDAVWPGEFPVDRTVDDHVYRLRRKVEPALGVRIIHSLRGIGYVLRLPPGGEGSVLRGLDRDRAQEAYLTLLRGCLVRGAGRQLLALVHDPPPGVAPGTDEVVLTAWLTGDLETVLEGARGGSGKARILAALTARDLFGIRAATRDLERAVDGGGFTADGRILMAAFLVEDGNPSQADDQIEAAREEIDAAGADILRPSLLRVRALALSARGDGGGAVEDARDGLGLARAGGLVREEALLSFLLTRLSGSPGYDVALSILHENRLGTDYLVMLRSLARLEPRWRGEFSTAAREFSLPALGREFRRLFPCP